VTLLAPDAIRVRVWERGSGATLACGSGACAAAAAGIVMGHLRDNSPVRVDMDGGSLFVTRNKDGHLLLRGPAKEIASVLVSV
jgi:diaminopimelate epimerase